MIILGECVYKNLFYKVKLKPQWSMCACSLCLFELYPFGLFELDTSIMLTSFLKRFKMVHTPICKPETDAMTFSTALCLQLDVAAVVSVMMNCLCLHASEYWLIYQNPLSSGPCYKMWYIQCLYRSSGSEQTDIQSYQENLCRYHFWFLR